MLNKDQIRYKYIKIRKKKYYEVTKKYFNPLKLYLNKKFKQKKIYLSFYYPSNREVNILTLFTINNFKKNIVSLLPSISGKHNMKFYKWNFLEPLKVNKYGLLEPNLKKSSDIPNVILVPLLAFDDRNYRLGYGKGYYDRYLNKYLNTNKHILTIGVAFSFQKYNKLPTNNHDVKLDYILTEKGMKKA
tara:strand:+ start:51 stop:614 length:564 start_codon:yes stop_codon:yes gene_type:complete